MPIQIIMQEKLPIKRKILLYLEYKGVSRYQFYKESGITRGVLDQKSGITEDNLLKFLSYAQDISLVWLFFDEGSMMSDIGALDTGMSSTGTSSVDDTLYKDMLKDKEKEIARLNREIGRLQHAVEHLKKGGKLFGFGVEVRTELDE